MEKFCKKAIIIKILIVVIVILLTKIAMSPLNKNYTVSTWMKELDDSKLINEMAIPGTHDSGATHSIFDVSGKCQDMSIKNQLAVGIRFLDIRLRLVNNELNIVHSFVDQKTKFINVLEEIDKFVKENPSEFLVISIKEDNSPKNSDIDFLKKVLSDLSLYTSISLNVLPSTLGEARGKVYILNRFTSLDVGINGYNGWKDSTTFEIDSMLVQDNYCVDTIEEKINDIEKTLVNNDIESKTLKLNFTSCYLENSFPPTYAGTPARKINKWLMTYVEKNSFQGILIMDFVTKELVEKVYMVNYYEKNN